MPLYEYQCATCGRFELIQKFSDEPLKVCPTCGGEVHKMLSAPAIQFKGTGWYVTDYARKGGEPGEKKAAAKESGSDGGSTADSGAKPASPEGASKPSSSKTNPA